MSRVILELSVSLDGYAAGHDVSPENPMGDNARWGSPRWKIRSFNVLWWRC